MDHNDELMHHGIKGMRWGVRRTPAQLGHDVAKAGRATADTVKKTAKAIGDARQKREQAKRDALVAKAMSPTAKKKDLVKALPYMTDGDIQAKMNRRKLESQLLTSEKKGSSANSTLAAIKKGMDLGTTDAVKDVYGNFLKQTTKPLLDAAGKATGEKLLSVGAEAAITASAKKYGVDPEYAKQAASLFKTSMREDFASVAASRRSAFDEKNPTSKALKKVQKQAKKEANRLAAEQAAAEYRARKSSQERRKVGAERAEQIRKNQQEAAKARHMRLEDSND